MEARPPAIRLGFCYGQGLSLCLRIVGFITDWLPGSLMIWFLSLFEQHSLSFVFRIVRWLSLIQRRQLPPRFNTNFKASLVGVKHGQAKWLAECPDRKKSDPVIIYLHGGGYSLALQTPQAIAMCDLYDGVGNPRLSILVLQYTTTVYAQYPRQLQDLAEVYNALSPSCSNIILFGDSAGGQLSLQLMRHIQSPELNVPHVTQRPSAFVGISPAVDMNPFQKVVSVPQSQFDINSVNMMKTWSKMISCISAVRDGPTIRLQLDHQTNWKTALPPSDKVFVAYSDREILAESIKEFLALSGLENGATIYSSANDFHDSLAYVGSLSPMMKPACEFLKVVA